MLSGQMQVLPGHSWHDQSESASSICLGWASQCFSSVQPLEELALCPPPPQFHLSVLPLTPSKVFPPHRGLSKVGRFLYVPFLLFAMKSMSVSLYQIIKSPLKLECLTSCYQLDPQVSA